MDDVHTTFSLQAKGTIDGKIFQLGVVGSGGRAEGFVTFKAGSDFELKINNSILSDIEFKHEKPAYSESSTLVHFDINRKG